MAETSEVMPIFYKSAFLSCVEDKRRSRRPSTDPSHKSTGTPQTIKTVRDHAHLLVDFIDDIIMLMFDSNAEKKSLDLEQIGEYFRKWPLAYSLLDRSMSSQIVALLRERTRTWLQIRGGEVRPKKKGVYRPHQLLRSINELESSPAFHCKSDCGEKLILNNSSPNTYAPRTVGFPPDIMDFVWWISCRSYV